jgi:hypothetical protein
VNFTGAFDPISIDEIQVTRALMIAGAVQASEARGEPGLRKFSDAVDLCIAREFSRLVGKQAPYGIEPGLESTLRRDDS